MGQSNSKSYQRFDVEKTLKPSTFIVNIKTKYNLVSKSFKRTDSVECLVEKREKRGKYRTKSDGFSNRHTVL